MNLRRNQQPNILLVVVDCLRADHCSVYGYQRNTTPTIERLASEGVAFEQTISPACWSLPAHASMFTGLYPSKHGVHDEQHYLDASIPVIAEELHRAGYTTVGYCGNPWVNSATGLSRGFQYYDDLRTRDRGMQGYFARGARKLRRLLTGHATRRADTTTDLAVRSLRELSQGSEPFFIFIHYNEPHTPRHLPRAAAESFLSPYTWADAEPLNRDVNGYIAGSVKWTDRELDIYRALYDASIRYVDDRLDRLIDTLRHENSLDDTLVIITADHGENLGDHGLLGHKLCLYDTLIHVPLILRYPQAIDGGQRVDELVQTVDLFPTISDLAGLENRWENDDGAGRSLLGSRAKRDATYAEQFRPDLSVLTNKNPYFDTTPFDRRLRTIRTSEWKYIWGSDGRNELYRIADDPSESQDLINVRPDVARELDGRLSDWVNSVESLVIEHPDVEFDPAVTERLRALGYIP